MSALSSRCCFHAFLEVQRKKDPSHTVLIRLEKTV
jgi:hypothetical protein